MRDGHVEPEHRAGAPQPGVVQGGKLEAQKFAARGRVDGRMYSVDAPLDEKRKQASPVFAEPNGPPSEKAAVRSLALTRLWSVEGQSRSAEAGREGVEIARMHCPADESRSRVCAPV